MPKATSDDNEPDGSVRPESKKPKAMSGTKRAFLVVGVLIWGTIVASATISNNRSGAWDKVFASKSVSAPSVDIPNTPEPSSVIEAPAETPSSASLVDFQLSSKMKLEELLREPSSAEYSNVRAHLISKVGERPN